jgi:hypothetical protein
MGFVFRNGGKDVDRETVRAREVHRDEIHTGLHKG